MSAPKKKSRPGKSGRVRLLAVCYAVALLSWVLFAGLRVLRDTLHQNDGSMAPATLTLGDCEAINGLIWKWDVPEVFVSADADARLVFHFEGGQYVSFFKFAGRPVNKGAGEMVLYYTTGEAEPFSETRKVWAQLGADGSWLFDLGGKTVSRLRFDPDNVGGVYWQVGGMWLNPGVPLAGYWTPDALQVVVMLLAPLLCWGTLCEVIAFARPIVTRRRFEKRWGELAK